ncbi:MAG: ABC transporter ATP-binding protein [Aedoeadaptatus pacaensis]
MEIKNLSYAYTKGHLILNKLNLKVTPGAITTLMGANGSGKSTLLKILSRQMKPSRGRVLLHGKDIFSYPPKDYARQLGIVHQQNRIIGDLKVKDYVSYGRNPYLKPLQKYSAEDMEEIERAMDMTGITELAQREIRTLSGGQKQRVFIAMALAQCSDILLLDEPTTYLDIKYQLEILRLVKKINEERNTTIIMVLHDIMQAINYSHEVIGMYHGKIVYQGDPKEVLNSRVISKLYGTELELLQVDDTSIVKPKED